MKVILEVSAVHTKLADIYVLIIDHGCIELIHKQVVNAKCFLKLYEFDIYLFELLYPMVYIYLVVFSLIELYQSLIKDQINYLI